MLLRIIPIDVYIANNMFVS